MSTKTKPPPAAKPKPGPAAAVRIATLRGLGRFITARGIPRG